MIDCTCGLRDWEFYVDGETSWIICMNCDDSMFGDEIGVILVNWKKTAENFDLEDVKDANKRGVVLGE